MSRARDLANHADGIFEGAVTGSLTGNLTGNVTGNINGLTPQASNMQPFNLIINGAMNVAQRGTSASLASGNFTLDRFKIQSSNLDNLVGTMTQDSDAPDGFANSLKITTTTAETAIASNEYFYVAQFIEAQNLQQLSFGSSAAKDITVSFWIKSTQTGVFAVSLYTADNAGIANSTYTISSASTWEYKTITFTGDTARAINNDSGIGMYVNFHLAAGTDFNSDPTDETFEAYSDAKWAGGHVQNGVITTASATWQITGVQLEAGSSGSSFAHEDYATTLRKCYRFYWRFNSESAADFVNIGVGVVSSDNTAFVSINLPEQMRSFPALSYSALSDLRTTTVFGGGGGVPTAVQLGYPHTHKPTLYIVNPSGQTLGQARLFGFNNTYTGWIGWDAEL